MSFKFFYNSKTKEIVEKSRIYSRLITVVNFACFIARKRFVLCNISTAFLFNQYQINNKYFVTFTT